ncbi:MAG: phage integrase SAM-like domain-containing protein [Chlorobium sp.]|nr:phage integrase SAM-like domain-containing protein [Chlorobium sp.]
MAVSTRQNDQRSANTKKTTERVTLDMGGRALTLYRIKDGAKNSSPYWQCRCFIDGKSRQVSTKEENLSSAKEAAKQWYASLILKMEQGLPLKSDPRMLDSVAESYFQRCDELVKKKRRHKNYTRDKRTRYKNYLHPFLGQDRVHEIATKRINEWLKWRNKQRLKTSELLTSELKKEIEVLRAILNEAISEGVLESQPSYPPSIRLETMSVKKPTNRIYFNAEEFKLLIETATSRAQEAKELALNPPPKGGNYKKIYHDRLYLYYYLNFLAYTGMRPEEAQRVRLKDIHIHIKQPLKTPFGGTYFQIRLPYQPPDPYKDQYLTVDVKGKRKDRKIVAKEALVPIFEHFKKSIVAQGLNAEDRIFAHSPYTGLNSLLGSIDLKIDNMGRKRDAKSLRHYYIMQSLADGIDIYQLSQHCDVSPDVIRNHYAAHMPSEQFKAQLISNPVNDLL